MASVIPMAPSSLAIAPPYPAALAISGASWQSSLTNHGRVILAREQVQIGRMEGNDVVLNDPLVSRHHAVIRWTTAGYELEDLGAVNGTTVQGQRIQGRVLLAPGQLIQIGKAMLVFNVFNPQEPANLLDVVRQAAPMAPSGTAQAATAISPQQVANYGLSPAGAVALGAGQYSTVGHPFYDMMARKRENAIARFFRTEWRKQYWRIFLLGVVAYFVVTQVLVATQNLHLVPLQLLLASALVPVVFVIFCFEQHAFADMPLGVVGVTFMSGAILGLTIAAILEPLLLPPTIASGSTITLSAALLIGVCEEGAKVISVLWFLRDKRLRNELDGLILGAAAGMGFAALETAGYGFVAFLSGFTNALANPNVTATLAIDAGIHQMNLSLVLRMALAIFGHGVWTAIVCAAIWRDRGQRIFRLTFGVVLAFALAVTLHALWDWTPLTQYFTSNTDPLTILLVVVGWFLLVGGAGMFFLGFFLRESLRRAKLGPNAPPPPPLLGAIIADTFRPFLGRQAPQPAYLRSTQQGAAAPPVQAPNGYQPPLATAQRVAYCPRCGLSYPSGTKACSRCHGPLV